MIKELLFELYKLFIYSVYACFIGSLSFVAVFSILERHFPSYFQRDVSEDSFRDLSQASCFGLRNGEYSEIRKASQRVISHLILNRGDRYLRSNRSSGYGFKILWSMCFFWVYPVVLVIPPMEMLSYASRSQSTSYLEMEADYFLNSLWNIVVDIQDRDYEALEYRYSKYLGRLGLFKILIRLVFNPADFVFNRKLIRIWLVKFILLYDYGLGGVFDRSLTMIGYIFSFSFWLVSLSHSVQFFLGGIAGNGMGSSEFVSIYVMMLSITGVSVSFYQIINSFFISRFSILCGNFIKMVIKLLSVLSLALPAFISEAVLSLGLWVMLPVYVILFISVAVVGMEKSLGEIEIKYKSVNHNWNNLNRL